MRSALKFWTSVALLLSFGGEADAAPSGGQRLERFQQPVGVSVEELAQPAERLRDAYFSYIAAKACYELPRNKDLSFITEAEMAAAKKAVAAKEKQLLSLESLDTEHVWKLAKTETVKLAAMLRVLETRPDSEFREFCHSYIDELLSPIDPFGAYDVKKDF